MKYVGVAIDSKLDLSSHAQLMRTKLSRTSHVLFKIKKFVVIAVVKLLYCCIALFIVIYNTVPVLCRGAQLTNPSCNL